MSGHQSQFVIKNRPLSFLHTVARARRRAVTLPRFLTYIVTFSCNARCIMCDSWRKPSPNDLKLHEIDTISKSKCYSQSETCNKLHYYEPSVVTY